MDIFNRLMLHEIQLQLKQPRGMFDVVKFYSCYQFTKERLKKLQSYKQESTHVNVPLK